MQRIFIHRCQNQAFYSVHLSDVYSTHTYIRIEYQRLPFGLGRDEMGREEGVNPQPQLLFCGIYQIPKIDFAHLRYS